MAHIKVLIVEDELIIAEDMRQMLREMEYEVIGITGDCEEAMELLSSDTLSPQKIIYLVVGFSHPLFGFQ